MPFKKGQSGNPSGRPKGSVNIMNALRDLLLNKFYDNVELFDEEMDKAIKQNPLGFYKDFIEHLAPKSLSIDANIKSSTVSERSKSTEESIANIKKSMKSK